jgi:hypothetical protein
MLGGGLGVDLLDVLGQWCSVWTIDGDLCPLLGVAPRGGAGSAELDGGFAVCFMDSEGVLDNIENRWRVRDLENWKPPNIGDREVNSRVQCAQR